jgi:hypothetical protein
LTEKAAMTFTPQELRQWSIRAAQVSSSTPQELAQQHAPNVLATRCAGHGRGLALTITADNGTTSAFELNPVAARDLLTHLMATGVLHGWLNGDHQITIPAATGSNL